MAFGLWLTGCVSAAAPHVDGPAAVPDGTAAGVPGHGWSWLAGKLVDDGVPREQVARVFSDDGLPPFTGLEFSLSPGESQAMYRHFLTPGKVEAARACHDEWADDFAAAGRAHGVRPSVLAAIIFVESGCGRNTGRSMVFYRLARLAMANEPSNVERNVGRLAIVNGVVDVDKVAQARKRAQYLEDTFYPEVKALFEMEARYGIDPLDVRGSTSGAFGNPQFLPTSYLRSGADGNGDGHVSLYDMPDAIASAATYFEQRGWRPGLTHAEQRKVVWEYNRSDAYIDTVLALADAIDGVAPPSAPAKRGRKPARGLTRAAHRGRTATHAAAKHGTPPRSRAARVASKGR